MTTPATLAGDPVTIGEFSAFKALYAMELVSDIEDAWKAMLDQVAAFKTSYAEKNMIRLQRVDARRRFRPAPMYGTRRLVADDGETITEVIDEPVLKDGEPIIGPDPLGHLTDEDWQACGNVLEMREAPSDAEVWAAMVPAGFKLAREQVLRLLALGLTTNRTLEEWDGEKAIADELDRKAREIVHRAKADELVRLAVAVMHACRDQLRGPFDEARAAWKSMQGTTEETTETSTIEPMRIEQETSETGDSESRSTSSTASADATAGTPASSSIESESVASSV